MQKKKVHRSQIPQFSGLQELLAYNQEALAEFINRPFSKENVLAQIQDKSLNYSEKFRETLVAALTNQYVSNALLVPENVKQLGQTNTFTVTTGHQLNLFTGPLYFLYKITHAIKLAEELNAHYPDYHFVPVYWMASEDHDFAEINHFYSSGKAFEWETPQEGPVGLFDLENWEGWKTELLSYFERDQDKLKPLLDSYSGVNLKEATRKLVHALFGKYGLVCVDGDDAALKKIFRKTMVKEVLEGFSAPLVEMTNQQLVDKGIKPQVQPRPINLFFIEKGHRERLVPVDGAIQINGKGEFSAFELVDLIENRPELFSPNVVLRPVYQETILPNLCYIGGGGELAYWIQLKGVFDKLELTYPLISLRNSFQLIDEPTRKKIEQLGMDVVDFFQPLEVVKKRFLAQHTSDELDFSAIGHQLDQIELDLKQKAEQVDKTLVAAAGGEMTRIKKSIEAFKGRLMKAEKQRFDLEMQRIEKLHDKILPQGNLQERKENFTSYYVRLNPDFIELVLAATEPFESDFMYLEY